MAISDDILLGKDTEYRFDYAPDVLFPVSRSLGREVLGINGSALPFIGHDLWTAFEISWLRSDGLPQVAIGDFLFDCASENLVESKSFKLYLNSFNQTVVESREKLVEILQRDLAKVSGANVQAQLYFVDEYPLDTGADYLCIDEQEMPCNAYEPDAAILEGAASGAVKHERLKSHLLRSLCPVTGQPDWATLYLEYKGSAINHQQLLAYVVSFRNHQGFHEQCVEQIFSDIMQRCGPDELSVYARYTRRGGLDINPWRANNRHLVPGIRRTARQ